MSEELYWAIIGAVAALIGLPLAAAGVYYSWRQFRIAHRQSDRLIDIRLWRRREQIVEAYLTLTNNGTATATIDRIEVRRPKGSKVAWHIERDEFHGMRSLQDPDADNVHAVRLIVEPGKSAGVGMVIELPRTADDVPFIQFRSRLMANDLRAPKYIDVRVHPSLALDRRQ